MNDIQLTAIVVALTGIFRSRLPKVDKLVIPLIAIALGAVFAALNDFAHWREALIHGAGVGLSAVGGMTALGYAGEKFGAAFGNDTTTPSTNTPPTVPAVVSAVISAIAPPPPPPPPRAAVAAAPSTGSSCRAWPAWSGWRDAADVNACPRTRAPAPPVPRTHSDRHPDKPPRRPPVCGRGWPRRGGREPQGGATKPDDRPDMPATQPHNNGVAVNCPLQVQEGPADTCRQKRKNPAEAGFFHDRKNRVSAPGPRRRHAGSGCLPPDAGCAPDTGPSASSR